MKFRVGLVGMGVHGTRYARHMLGRGVKGLAFVACTRRDSTLGKQQADKWGVDYEPSVDALTYRKDIDLIIVASSPESHHGAAMDAMADGKAVLIEKPVCLNVPQACELIVMRDMNRRTAMVAHTLRFNTVIKQIKFEMYNVGRVRQLRMSHRLEFRGEPRLGQPMLHHGVHLIDLARWLTGQEWESVYCTESQRFAAVSGWLRGGIHVDLEVFEGIDDRTSMITVVGEKGQLHGDHGRNFLTFSTRGNREYRVFGDPVPTVKATLEAMSKAMHDNTPVPITLEDGLQTLRVVEACNKSEAFGTPQIVKW